MTKDEAMKLALSALESYSKSDYIKAQHPRRKAAGDLAIKALREAMSPEPTPEPQVDPYLQCR